jgi:excisionase family DNA binding protein
MPEESSAGQAALYLRNSTRYSSSNLTPFLLRPEEAAELLGIGRSKLFELLASGAIRSVRIGNARRIPLSAVQEFVQRLTASGETSADDLAAPDNPSNSGDTS